MPRLRTRFVAVSIAAVVCLATTTGCKENGNDYYAEGLRLLGQAEGGDCKLGYDSASGQQTINASRITTCLETTRAALEQLYKARELGVDHRESKELIQKTEEEIAKMESMLRMVSRMEHEKGLYD